MQFAAGNAPALTQQLAKSGKVADLEKELKSLGVLDQLEPAAVSTIKELYGGELRVLPYEYNIEGIFYNKKLFQEDGLKVPGTWEELVAAAAKLESKGVQPFSASGQQGWPLTRLISGHLYRSLGPDALQKVADGKAKLTGPREATKTNFGHAPRAAQDVPLEQGATVNPTPRSAPFPPQRPVDRPPFPYGEP